MNMPGKPVLAVVPDPPTPVYEVIFGNDNDQVFEVAADIVQWGSAFVRFYRRESDNEHILLHAFHNETIVEVREVR